MGAMASQITGVSIVYSSVGSGANQRKHESSASLAFVKGIHRWIPAQKASNTEKVFIWWRHHARYFPRLSLARDEGPPLYHRTRCYLITKTLISDKNRVIWHVHIHPNMKHTQTTYFSTGGSNCLNTETIINVISKTLYNGQFLWHLLKETDIGKWVKRQIHRKLTY